MTRWLKVAGVLALVWVVAVGLIYWSRSSRPTPQSLSTYMEEQSVAMQSLAPAERGRVLRKVADQLNRLEFKDREELRKLRKDREFFRQLTPEERKEFLELTLPQGFRELMKALNAMSPDERKKIVRRALRGIERDNPELSDRFNEKDAAQVVSRGLEAFYEDANAEVKLDFAPVIERLQRASQNLR